MSSLFYKPHWTKYAQNDTMDKKICHNHNNESKKVAAMTIGEGSDMYVNSGYLNNTRVPIKDKSKPLLVGSCGTYRLRTKKKLPTWRPRGRLDYQLLYVASGKTHFFFNGQEEIVPAGYMVLYQPRQEQHYEYYGEEQPEVYWGHFTGRDVKSILKHFDIPIDKNVFFSGVPSAYQHLFKEMIRELQTCRTGYQELLEMD